MKTYKVTVDQYNTIRWYNKENKLHREDGPAVGYANGRKYWRLNGKRHREDGPAVEWSDGHKEWHLNGELHREDGPAVMYSDGINCWFINGIKFTEEEFNNIQKRSSIKKKTSKHDFTKQAITIGVTIDGKDYFKDSAGNYVAKK